MNPRFFTISFVILPILGFRTHPMLRSHPMGKPTDNFYEERVAKTTIVSYRKNDFKEQDILNHGRRLESDCNCEVTHLRQVGAFILSYDHKDHTPAVTLSLEIENVIAVEDIFLSIMGDAVRPAITSYPEKLTNGMPDDPLFRYQWPLQHLGNDADINAVQGWDEYLSDSVVGNEEGETLIVAVIDTGVDYNHTELRNMMWKNPGEIEGNGIDDDDNGIIDDVFGASFADFNKFNLSFISGDPTDNYGHGTHCAGIIGAEENNGIGIAGVASFSQGKVKIMAVKGLSDFGFGTTGSLLSSLDYAIEHGANISSNSWGSNESVTPWEEKMWSNILENNPNHIFVAAAGNDNLMINSTYKPMACGLDAPNLLCVASSTIYDTKSSFSNYGKDWVDVFAPGSNIYSTYPNNQYAIMSGTSMATPHVTGLAALVMSMRNNLSGEEVKELIKANVQEKTAYADIVSSGGLIDVAKTIQDLKMRYH